MDSRDEGERVPKLVWRVKLVAEFETGETTEVEVARLERDEQAGLADLGLRLSEAKQLTAAIQAEMVPAQVTIAGLLVAGFSGVRIRLKPAEMADYSVIT
jgi:hypothetical protein